MKIHTPNWRQQSAEYARLAEEFKRAVRGNNFMTPTLVGYAEIPNGVVEITKGDGLERNAIYGVTVVVDGKQDKELCQMLHGMVDVEHYIDQLQETADT